MIRGKGWWKEGHEEERIKMSGGGGLGKVGKRSQGSESEDVERQMERGEADKSITPSIDQLMCCREDVILPEIDGENGGTE